MTTSFSSITLQAVLAPEGRRSLLPRAAAPELRASLADIVASKGQTLLASACLPDHVHLLLTIDAETIVSKFLQQVKSASTLWMNRKRFLQDNFSWQRGFGVFGYSQTHIPALEEYFNRQESYHREHSFREEYTRLLRHMEIPFEDRHLFEFYDEVRTWRGDEAPRPRVLRQRAPEPLIISGELLADAVVRAVTG